MGLCNTTSILPRRTRIVNGAKISHQRNLFLSKSQPCRQNYFVLFFDYFMLIFLVFLQLQKITSRRQADQKFSRRNNRSQEGRMCDVGPQATSRLIRASAQRHPALRGSNGPHSPVETQNRCRLGKRGREKEKSLSEARSASKAKTHRHKKILKIHNFATGETRGRSAILPSFPFKATPEASRA